MGEIAAPLRLHHRAALDEVLAAAAASRVCAIVAAAGWGKSAAARRWPGRAVWVRSSGPAAGPAGFARRLLEALRPHLAAGPPGPPDPPGLPGSIGPPGSTDAAGRDAASYPAILCDWLRGSLSGELTVVVDDLHELAADPGVAQLVDGLCLHAPDGLHVLLVSRQEPPFSLTRLRGRGEVREIGAAELALGLGEVAALLREEVGKCTVELARQVWERTAGWPAAVCTAVGLLRGEPEDERLAALGRLTHPGERFHGYLAEEVVGAEPPLVRQLLRWLAVFGRMRPANAAAAAAATGIADAPAVLADLARRGLVVRVAGDGDRWALPRPLRDYFDHEPTPGSERAALHRAAAAEHAGHGAFEAALWHAAAAGDYEASVALLVEHGPAMINGGGAEAVLAAAGELPAAHRDDQRLQLVLGQARQVRGHWAGALECLRRCGGDEPVLPPALAWRLAVVAYDQAEYGAVLRLGARAGLGRDDARGHGDPASAGDAAAAGGPDGAGHPGSSLEPDAAGGAAADAARLLALVAMARRLTGDLAGARDDAERARRLARGGIADSGALAAAHTALAMLAAGDGDRRRVEAHRASALDAARYGGDLLQELRALVQHAQALCELGLPEAARAAAGAAIDLGVRCGDVLQVARARTARGVALARLGELEQALADLDAARVTFQRHGSRLLAGPLCGLADVHRIRGQLARARAAYEEALAIAEPCHDLLAMGSALAGLARVRAADSPASGAALARRAVAVDEDMRRVPALLARGWVALAAGDRGPAGADAAQAAAVARQRRDHPGLAEALVLGAACAADAAPRNAALAEAGAIWRDTGCRLAEAATLLVASRLAGAGAATASAAPPAAPAVELLRSRGVQLGAPRPAGLLAVLAGPNLPLSIRALGAFRVVRNGVPISRAGWQSRKARQLLKIIVARRLRPVPREQLMELLWPDADPVKAGNRLSVLLSTLRAVLQQGQAGPGEPAGPLSGGAEGGPLRTDGSGVWLDRALVEVDVEHFLQRAQAALDGHRRDDPDAVAGLVAAEAAHTGEFLEDDPYEEWAASVAEEVHATHVALLRALVSRLRRAGEVDEVVRYSLRLLDKDRFDEQAHLGLVRLLLAAGRHGEARRRYRLYQQAMAELGIEPQPLQPVRDRDPTLADGGCVIS